MSSVTGSTDLESLLEYIKATRGFDFTGYKRPSLERRVQRRMQTVGAEAYDTYRTHLDKNPDEFVELFNTILINVTAFFRDTATWEFLRNEIVPRVVAESTSRDTLRIWSTGCASGEEAYSLAMCFAEALGPNEFASRLKIYATDVDEEALAEGRQGIYTGTKLEHVPQELRERYFERADGQWLVSAPLRRAVIFGRHDIVHDPPISKVDLLACRNTLMYFTPETQQRILANFHFALQSTGYLFLGKSEMMLGRSPLFAPVELKRRVFRKITGPNGFGQQLPRIRPELLTLSEEGSMRDAGFETGPVAQLIVDRAGSVTLANSQARALFKLGHRDLGRPLRDLEVSYRPVELRPQIEKSYAERQVVTLREIEWAPEGGERRVFDVQIAPLLDADSEQVGVGISFVDTTRYKRLQEAVELSKRDVETAYEELQSTVEELETTNEELQSTNEELETTNEELQSTNEELETMNEELQSTNEELETINDELNTRTDDLNQTNFFLESILASLDTGVAVLDQDLRVAAWNDGARDLWGLRADEAEGQYFLNLDIGLPLDALRSELRNALAGEPRAAVEVAATDRRGRPITCRVRVSPLGAIAGVTVRGLIVFMESIAP